MQLAIEDSSLERVVDQIMIKRGYVPEDSLTGKTIGIKEFAKNIVIHMVLTGLNRKSSINLILIG